MITEFGKFISEAIENALKFNFDEFIVKLRSGTTDSKFLEDSFKLIKDTKLKAVEVKELSSVLNGFEHSKVYDEFKKSIQYLNVSKNMVQKFEHDGGAIVLVDCKKNIYELYSMPNNKKFVYGGIEMYETFQFGRRLSINPSDFKSLVDIFKKAIDYSWKDFEFIFHDGVLFSYNEKYSTLEYIPKVGYTIETYIKSLEQAKKHRKQMQDEEDAEQKIYNTYVPELLNDKAISFLDNCMKNKKSCGIWTKNDENGYLTSEIGNCLRMKENGLIPNKKVDFVFESRSGLNFDKNSDVLLVYSGTLSKYQDFFKKFAKENPKVIIVYVFVETNEYDEYFKNLPNFKLN